MSDYVCRKRKTVKAWEFTGSLYGMPDWIGDRIQSGSLQYLIDSVDGKPYLSLIQDGMRYRIDRGYYLIKETANLINFMPSYAFEALYLPKD